MCVILHDECVLLTLVELNVIPPKMGLLGRLYRLYRINIKIWTYRSRYWCRNAKSKKIQNNATASCTTYTYVIEYW